MKEKNKVENKSKEEIPFVSGLIESIRKRPAMYLGQMNFVGFKEMLRWLLQDVAENELAAPVVVVEFLPNHRFTLKLTGVDVSKSRMYFEALAANSTQRAEFLGMMVLMVLSRDTKLCIHDHAGTTDFVFRDHLLVSSPAQFEDEEEFIFIDVAFDEEVFPGFVFRYESVNSVFRQFAYLNPTVTIVSVDKTVGFGQQNAFHYPSGIFQQLDYMIDLLDSGAPVFRMEIETSLREGFVKIGFCFAYSIFGEGGCKTFAGNIETGLGGSLEDGILDGIVLAIRQYALLESIHVKINRKLVGKWLLLVAAVQSQELHFYGATKTRLDMPMLRQDVKKVVFNSMIDRFRTNPAAADKLMGCFKVWITE